MPVGMTVKTVLKRKAGYPDNQGTRTSKNSIPKVNPDPRPPNEPKASNKGQDNRAKGNQQNQGNNKGKHGGKDHNKPNSSSNQQNQQGNAQQPAYAQPTDPRDSQYWQDLIRAQQDRNLNLRGLDIEQTYSNSAYQEALGALARQLPRDVLGVQEGANAGGSFYSSKTGEDVGKVVQDYFLQQSGLRRNQEREDSLRSLQRDMISQGYTADEAAAYAASVDRASQNEANRPAPGSDVLQKFIKKLLQAQQGGGKGGKNHGGKGKGKGKNK